MKTPWHLWLFGALSLIWNAMGAFQWFQQVTGDPAYWDKLTLAQAVYLRAAPVWTDVAFGLAVWAGVLGALLLLLRRRLSFHAYVAALIGFIADSVYVHLLSNGREAMGTAGVLFGVIVFVICVVQVVYSRRSLGRGLLR